MWSSDECEEEQKQIYNRSDVQLPLNCVIFNYQQYNLLCAGSGIGRVDPGELERQQTAHATQTILLLRIFFHLVSWV